MPVFPAATINLTHYRGCAVARIRFQKSAVLRLPAAGCAKLNIHDFRARHTRMMASEPKMLTREESDKTIVKETANVRRCPSLRRRDPFVGQKLAKNI
jgi:hypothetical protein